MQRRLILHIGDCKTGSTILQSMLALQDCVPQDVRLFYPGNGAHGGLARSLGDRNKAMYPRRWKVINQRLNRDDWDVAVLSSELFEFSRPKAVARALREQMPDYADSVQVIAYVRPHASRTVSQFAENLKLGHDTNDFATYFDRFSAAGRLNYADRLDQWKTEFGDRLTVRPFVRDRLVGGDVRRDFLSLILPDTPYTLADGGQDSNAALTVPDLALMRMLQRHFGALPGIDIENRVAFGKQFGRLLRDLPPTGPAEPLRLPRPIYDRLRRECLADAERMDSEWIGAACFVPDLIDAETRTVDRAQSLQAEDYHSAETLRLMTAWADLIARQMTDETRDFAPRLRPSE